MEDEGVEAYKRSIQDMEYEIREDERKKVTKKLEKEFRSKYAKNKSKTIKVTLHCVMCTKNFEIKRKNNKSDATAVQVCPHTVLRNWEVDHSE